MTQPLKKIAIIICHFGELPWYFSYFVHSAKYNPTVDFFLISDDRKFSSSVPHNMFMIFKTLKEVSALFSMKLGFSVCIENAYKMCDFKPVYGLLFAEILRGYDVWGYGDIDVIFGNIRHFITTDIIENHDIISVRHDYLTGYFQLFRNSENMIMLFMESPDYKKVFTNAAHFCFDETNFQFEAFREAAPLNTINSEIQSMMHVVRKLQENGEIRAYFDFHVAEGIPGKLRWEKGRLFYKRQFEVVLYHLIHFKKIYKPGTVPKFIPESFTISTRRIYHSKKSKIQDHGL